MAATMASLLFMVSAVVSVADGSRVSSPPPMPSFA